MAGSRIKGITVEIGGDCTALDKALKGVNSTIKTTQSELKDIERLLKLDPSNTELLAQKQATLKEAVGATKDKLDALKTAQEQAKQQMENGDLGKDKYDALQREIIATEQELAKLAKEAANANTTLCKIEEAGKKFESFGNKLTSVGSSLTRNVTAPILAIGTAAVKVTADFDESMSKVKAISGATGEQFDQLREKAREMGAKTKFSASEAADAMTYMAMAGWDTESMLESIEGIMNLAAASGEDLATTSDIVTDALTAFGLAATDSGHFADVLASASASANTNVSLLGESFKMCAPVCGSLGISAEDCAVALGLMANAGIKGCVMRKQDIDAAFRKGKRVLGDLGRTKFFNDERRKTALTKMITHAEEAFSDMRGFSIKDSLTCFEIACFVNFHNMEDLYGYTLGAALWILDELRRSGKLHDAYEFLPSSRMEIEEEYTPTDFYHPCYEDDLIQSVAHVIDPHHILTTTRKQYGGLIGLLEQDRINAAAEKFKALQWKAAELFLRCEE